MNDVIESFYQILENNDDQNELFKNILKLNNPEEKNMIIKLFDEFNLESFLGNFNYYFFLKLFFHCFYLASMTKIFQKQSELVISILFFIIEIILFGITQIIYYKKNELFNSKIKILSIVKFSFLMGHSIFCISICFYIEKEIVQNFFVKFLYSLIIIKNLFYFIVSKHNFLICFASNICMLTTFFLTNILIKKFLENKNHIDLNFDNKINDVIYRNLAYIDNTLSAFEYFIEIFFSVFLYYLKKYLLKRKVKIFFENYKNSNYFNYYNNYLINIPGFHISLSENNHFSFNKHFEKFLRNNFLKNIDNQCIKYLNTTNKEILNFNIETKIEKEKQFYCFARFGMSNREETGFPDNKKKEEKERLKIRQSDLKCKSKIKENLFMDNLINLFFNNMKSCDDEKLNLTNFLTIIKTTENNIKMFNILHDSCINYDDTNIINKNIYRKTIKNRNETLISSKSKYNYNNIKINEEPSYFYNGTINNYTINTNNKNNLKRNNERKINTNHFIENNNSSLKNLISLQNVNLDENLYLSKLNSPEFKNNILKKKYNSDKLISKHEDHVSNRENFINRNIIDRNLSLSKRRYSFNYLQRIKKRICEILEINKNKETYNQISNKRTSFDYNCEKKESENELKTILIKAKKQKINDNNKKNQPFNVNCYSNSNFLLMGEFSLNINMKKNNFIIYYRKIKGNIDLIINNITIAKSEENLECETKIKHKILSKISHEFKTPINNILGLVNNLRINNKKNYQNNHELDLIKSLSHYTIYIISDLIQYASNDYSHLNEINNKQIIEKGQNFLFNHILMLRKNYNINFRIIDINKSLFFTFDILNALISCHETKKESIHTQLFLENIYTNFKIRTDEIRLNQILINLISNSVKFTKKGKIVIIADFIQRSKLKEYVKESNLKKNENIIINQKFNNNDNSISEKNEHENNNLFNNNENIINNCNNSKRINSKNIKKNVNPIDEIVIIPSKHKNTTQIRPSKITPNDLNKEKNEYYLKISIVDTGIGISEEKQDEIFNENIKINTEHEFNHQGSGLGLSLCLNLIKILNMKMIFSSKENVGSVFSLLIPVTKLDSDEINNKNNKDSIINKVPPFNGNISNKTSFEKIKSNRIFNKLIQRKSLKDNYKFNKNLSSIKDPENIFNIFNKNINNVYKKSRVVKKHSMFDTKLGFNYKKKFLGDDLLQEITDKNDDFKDKKNCKKEIRFNYIKNNRNSYTKMQENKSNFFRNVKYKSSQIVNKFCINDNQIDEFSSKIYLLNYLIKFLNNY